MRHAEMKQFSDVPEDGDNCGTDSFLCQSTEHTVATAQWRAVQDDIQLQNHAAVRQSTTEIDLHLAEIDPPIGQLPPGWNSFHDSGTKKDYYVSPTGHVQWQHPLQGPPPPPSLKKSGLEAGRSIIETPSFVHTEDPVPPSFTPDGQRKRNEDKIGEIPARSTFPRQDLEGSAVSDTPEHRIGTQRQFHSSSNGAAVPSTGSNNGEEQLPVEMGQSQSDDHVRDMLPGLASLVEHNSEELAGQQSAQAGAEEPEDASEDNDSSIFIILEREQPMTKKERNEKQEEIRRQKRKREREETKTQVARTEVQKAIDKQNRKRARRARKERKAMYKAKEKAERIQEQKEGELARREAEAKDPSLKQKRLQEAEEKRIVRAAAKTEELRKKHIRKRKEEEERKAAMAAAQAESLRLKRIQERGERRLARASVNWQAD
ncbi:hypothetical protein CBER1_03481 [Cercospora berteroae]|uniref:WW domain-containing protein n=1 Tax=Cercospora berteroae TaxID=357750 RepID=A0A2S6CLS7_9PEZI|nr:hypothetical protein CBER1_03481 [Cercospora berteroae]